MPAVSAGARGGGPATLSRGRRTSAVSFPGRRTRRSRTLIGLLPSALGAACYGPADFQEEAALSSCALYEECGYLSSLDVDSFEACLELLRSEAYACVEFDPEAGRACIDTLDALTCEEYGVGGYPLACLDACTRAE